MTWKEFKELVEEHGVDDSDELDFINVSGLDIAPEDVQRTTDDRGHILFWVEN